MLKRNVALFGLFMLIANITWAQQPSIKVKHKYEVYRDSLKQVDYNYVFPILGQGAYNKGFDIPYPVGIMGNFMWMEQGIAINNLQLGLQNKNVDIGLTQIDFVQFGENTNTSYTINVRPDIWVFPFLNVYGILGYAHTRTEVNLVYPVTLQSVVEQKVSNMGIGIMAAGAVGPVFISVDANFTWNKPELLDKAVPVRVTGIRLGHTYVFKEKPSRNIAVWVGGFFMETGSATSGQLKLKDALPAADGTKKDAIVSDYYNWYDNEATIPQKLVADQILTPIIDRLDAADGEAIIKYGLEKQVQQKWNGIIGAQFQYNKNWMLRTEWGVLGNRKSALLSVNYRFLL
ncbi:hypothetical protein OS188_06120 [Xanthomarina sp. F1114]|uniref:hypothetical protein n=1 Tax=Xanthomarina sp. F1114 TaxID=2996019 RepID=UPI00225DF7FD|nr:hypothetical protein [Xanthomarina sp. F1114]MCX7547527.1 hypothetical protein [Xanthomarina sp. F1114]